MVARLVLRNALTAVRTSRSTSILRASPAILNVLTARSAVVYSPPHCGVRPLSTARAVRIDILPDADKPEGDLKESEPHFLPQRATPIEDDAYHEYADDYLERLNVNVEMMQEKNQQLELDYSVRYSMPD